MLLLMTSTSQQTNVLLVPELQNQKTLLLKVMFSLDCVLVVAVGAIATAAIVVVVVVVVVQSLI